MVSGMTYEQHPVYNNNVMGTNEYRRLLRFMSMPPRASIRSEDQYLNHEHIDIYGHMLEVHVNNWNVAKAAEEVATEAAEEVAAVVHTDMTLVMNASFYTHLQHYPWSTLLQRSRMATRRLKKKCQLMGIMDTSKYRIARMAIPIHQPGHWMGTVPSRMVRL